MAAPRGGTRERILDAAEELFAAKGYDGTSTRDIVAESGDTVGSVNYHFGTKDKLLGDVLRRRWHVIAEARRDAYAQQMAKHHGDPPLSAVVESVVMPYLSRAMCGGKQWQSYAQLQGRLACSPDLFDETLSKLTEPVEQEIMGWLRRALPGADLVDLAYSFQFMVFTIVVECSADRGVDRLPRLTGGASGTKDFAAVAPRLIRFITGGIRAICEHTAD